VKLRQELLDGGAIAHLTLDAGKGNIVDRACIQELTAAHAWAVGERQVRAVVLDHSGPHFSFGASVQEHLPGEVETMLPELHRLVLQLAQSPVPLIACVRGACLGGGLELALACTRIVAAPDAKLGQPEVQLGVFAPVASVLLPLRMGEGQAARLLLSGASISGQEGHALGLVDELSEAPADAALSFCRTELLPKSSAALRLAHRALRLHTVDALQRLLPVAEKLYLEELMRTRDAHEGLRAFLDKRAAVWAHE
jgi:cyclohexa-1,5-dienecarbonyl-CoA hydratase